MVKLTDGSMIGGLNTKNDHSSAIADRVTATRHNIKRDHFEILASGKTNYHCKVEETLFIQDLKPAFSSEKLIFFLLAVAFCIHYC